MGRKMIISRLGIVPYGTIPGFTFTFYPYIVPNGTNNKNWQSHTDKK
jgi:hypothetical protein